jgi:Amt family ammonium transporter
MTGSAKPRGSPVTVDLIIRKIVDQVIGLRVSEEVERDGLDLALHGETVQ